MKLRFYLATVSTAATLFLPIGCSSSSSSGQTIATLAVTGIGLDKTALSLLVGGPNGTLTATLAPSDATNKAVTWGSSSTGVATVVGGVVTPVGGGSTTITATTVDGSKTATCLVTVTVPATGVTLDQGSLSLALGGASATLTPTVSPASASNKAVSWATGNPSVATVSNGVVSPTGVGSTLITVTTQDGSWTANCSVSVSIPVTSVTLDKTTLGLTAGLATGSLTATVNPANATIQQVDWSSSSPAVATVSASGVVTPLSAGTSTITATSGDGVHAASCALTVAASTGPQLIAIGTLGNGTDLSGLTGTLENGDPAAILGGMGSGLAWAGGYTFLSVPDRGPNALVYDATVDNTVSYIERFHTLSMSLTPNSGAGLPYLLVPTLSNTTLLSSPTALNYGSTSTPALTDVLNLNTANGVYYFTGRSDGFGVGNSSNPANARLDTEAIRVANDGKSLFISDEYGPYIYQFDRATGQRLKTFTLPSTFDISILSPVGATEISSNTSGRVTNKGMEGLAITPDGTILVGFMQGPLIQDGGDGGRCNRIVTIDIATGTTHQYIYDNLIASTGKNYNSSEFLAINSHEFLVLERDGKGLGDGTSAIIKRLYKIDITGATEVSALSGEATLLPYAVTKTLFLDIQAALASYGLAATQIPAKIEGAAFGPDLVVNGINKHTLWIANDNDFISVAGVNQFFVFAVSDADLGGSTYVPQVVADSSTSGAVTGATLSPGSLLLTAGGTSASLTPVVLPATATNKAVTWASSVPAVASVSGGTVTPLAVGSTTITVTTADGNHSATCAVSVVAPVISVTGVALDSTSLNFTLGDAAKSLTATVYPLNATNPAVTWASDASGVATVSNGTVSAAGLGTAHITVSTTDGGFSASCTVSVAAAVVPVASVSLDKSTMTVTGAKTLVATVLPVNATDPSLTWSSSNSSVATVSGGVVTAVGVGTTRITATSNAGSLSAFCDVTVLPFYGFSATGQMYSKTGMTGIWSLADGSTSAASLGFVVSKDGSTFFGLTSGTPNGNIYQKSGLAGAWSLVNSATASGTLKAAAFDGVNFFGFTATGKFNVTTLGGTWAPSNLGGTTGLALIAVVNNGTNLYGFTSTGVLYANTLANVISTNTWTQVSPEVAPVSLASVTCDGSTFYGLSATGLLYTKTGTAGAWSPADATNTSGATLVSLTCQ